MKKLILLTLLITPFLQAEEIEEHKPRVCILDGYKQLERLISGDFRACKAGDIMKIETRRIHQVHSVCEQGTLIYINSDDDLQMTCTLLPKEEFMEIVLYND